MWIGQVPLGLPAGGRPCNGPSIPCELTFILVMIPLARLPLWHPAMPSESPSITSFLRKLAWVGSAFHFRFGTLAVSAHWPLAHRSLRGKGPGGFLSPTGVAPGTVPGLACPSFPLCYSSAIVWLLLQGGCCDPPFCSGLYSLWAHNCLPHQFLRPLVGLGGPLVGLPWALVLPVGSSSYIGY